LNWNVHPLKGNLYTQRHTTQIYIYTAFSGFKQKPTLAFNRQLIENTNGKINQKQWESKIIWNYICLTEKKKKALELKLPTCSYTYGLVIQFNFERHSLSPMLNALISAKLHRRRSTSSIYLRIVSTRSRSFGSNKLATTLLFQKVFFLKIKINKYIHASVIWM